MGGLWKNKEGTGEGKYPIVLRRDGTVLTTPYFVMTLKDPCTSSALAAYADQAERLGLDPEYVSDVREQARLSSKLAAEDQLQRSGPTSDPDAPKHRRDHPVVIALAKHFHTEGEGSL